MNNLIFNVISFSSYFSSNDYNIILEPLSCIIRLIILKYKEEGTKISIYNNSINYDYPNNYQGIIRNVRGDSREHLHNLYNPLEKSLEWYGKDDERYNFFYRNCVLGLRKLCNTYDKSSIIYHTLQHYIKIIETNLEGGEIEKIDIEESPLLNELKNYWNNYEIDIIFTTLKHIESCNDEIEKEVYIENINTILNYKEQKVKDYIDKSSTTYNLS